MAAVCMLPKFFLPQSLLALCSVFLQPQYTLYFPAHPFGEELYGLVLGDSQVPDQLCARNGEEEKMAIFSSPLAWIHLRLQCYIPIDM